MCITTATNEYGYYWRYDHSPDEPDETLEAAIMMAVDVAANEARNAAKTYYVTITISPTALYILPAGHPELSRLAMNVMFELTPKGKVVQRKRPARH